MNIYRCKFCLTEHDNLESNVFVKAPSKEDAESQTKKIFDSTLSSRGIPNAKYTQTVTLSSEQEVQEYSEFMRKRSNSDKSLN